MTQKNQENNCLMKQASYASVIVAAALIVLKGITFLLTGAVSILSSLLDSVQDMLTSIVNMIAIKHATEPADNKHRFGHGKAQALGGLVQAFIIALAAFGLLIESCRRFFNPMPISHITMGVVITLFAILMTLILVRFQTLVVQKTQSLSIKADRAHYAGDVFMNIGVLISIFVSYYTGWLYVDSLFGISVSIYLGVTVYQVLKDSFSMLMDTEMPEEFRKQIKEITHSFPEVLMMHDLKTRQSGAIAFIQFCVHLDDALTLRQAHDITDKIEHQIKKRFPDTAVIIHAEPERKKDDC